MATPSIPPRPARSTQNPASSSSSIEVPKIPPRPKRSVDRSISPHRDTYARSPLNDPAFINGGKYVHKDSRLSTELPARPPSVSLPSIGQEGSEYASLEELHRTASQEPDLSPQQTKQIAGDLPLYAPTASLPSSSAKSRIATVTRTDSSQAAAAGFGKSLFPDDKSTHGPGSESSAGRSRPTSIYKENEETGIPEIGLQVPMYPNAGDVQAPTPSPYDQGAGSTGVGFFNKGGSTPASGRHHSRTKSGREIFHGPPGSYGLHGHGVIPNNDFEQKWYEKHPEDLKREKQGEYGPRIQENRKDYHWVGDDLVKLVRSSATSGIGMGTSREAIGTPDEQIGYMASEEYASRMASPRPATGRPPSIHKETEKVESPLKRMSFPTNTIEGTVEGEADDEVIHIDPPSHRVNKMGSGGYDPPKEDLGPEGGNTEQEGGWVSERGYGVPILASDEIDKHPAAEFRQPAVSPELERRGSGEYTINESDGIPSYITNRQSLSRNSSRNNSVQLPGLQRVISPRDHDRSSSALDNVKEYEPLFPEDEDEHETKPKTAVDKLKRPDLARHHFPSQDVWEDTPSSLLHTTEVETPQAPEEPSTPVEAESSKLFEPLEKEEARKNDITKEEQKSFLPEKTKRFAKSPLNKDVLDDMSARPGLQPRFPSHDIWEDAPDHGQLVTTVSGPQTEDTNEYAEDSPVVEKPSVPARPSIPARPQKAKEISPVDKKAPVIPDRPKPQVPARPSKPLTKPSEEKVPQVEAKGEEEAPQPKAKPPVPSRPGGSKIAALQAGFLKDLNSKLGLGPQAPKVKEPEPEQEEEAPKPLQDARKGRAKGPQRRKPTSSPSPAAAATATAEGAAPSVKLDFAPVTAVWSIGHSGEVDVPAARMAAQISKVLQVPSQKQTAPAEPDVVEDVVEKGEGVEPEEAELAKTLTEEKAVEPTVLEREAAPALEAKRPVEAEAEAEEPESDGGVSLEKEKNPAPLSSKEEAAPTPAAEIPGASHEEVGGKDTA